MLLISKATGYFKSNSVKNQIIFSFFLKGISICLSFYIIPTTLSLLTTEKYGIWITLQSVFSWILLFDIGVGNGLRNKLAKALAKGDLISSRIYISTAYFIISVIGIILITVILISVNFVNWSVLFKNNVLSNVSYTKLILISLLSLTICFVLGLVNQIFNALQKNWLTNVINIVANLLFIFLINYFNNTIQGNIVLLAGAYCSTLIISHIVITLIFFMFYPFLIPNVKYIQREKINDILKLGGNFFIIQIAVLFIFSVDNFLILQLLGASTVAEYNIVYKLFSVFNVAFTIIMGPFWSAFTLAHAKNDLLWIRRNLRNLQMMLIPLIAVLVIVCCFINEILYLWLPSNKVIIPKTSFTISMAVFVVVSYWNNIYSYYLNGISETKVQVNTAIVGAVINVPLAVLMVKYYHLGLTGIILAMIISLSLFSVFGPFITYNTLNLKKV